MAESPKDTTTTSFSSSSSRVLTAAQITDDKADLFIGTCAYEPCQHKFVWILDYHLSRTGHRAPAAHKCPRCSEIPTCLVCLERFDANTNDVCPSCDNFFTAQVLAERREKLVEMNLILLEEKPSMHLKARIESEKKRFRETWGVEPGNTADLGIKNGGGEGGEGE